MSKTRLILVGCFVLVFAAGVSAGLLVAHWRSRPPEHSWLASRLDLTPAQQEEMRRIWSQVMGGPGPRGDQRQALGRQRDRAIEALLTEEQRAEYEKIIQEHTRKLAELSQERRQAFAQAEERTKAILSPEQARKYEELLQQRRDRGRGGFPGRWPSRPGREHPSTATSQSRPADSEPPAPLGE